jgi:hypothetical protein
VAKACPPKITGQAAWRAVIASKLLSGDNHRYKPVQWEESRLPRGRPSCPMEQLLHPTAKLASNARLLDMAGPKPQPLWPTLTASSWLLLAADSVAWKAAMQEGRWHEVSFTWLSGLMQEGTLVQRKGCGQQFLSLGEMGGTAALGWPVEQGPGDTLRLKPIQQASGLEWLVCFDPDDWLAQNVSVRSPLHRFATTRKAADAVQGIAFIGEGTAEPLLRVAARSAFWKLSGVWLARLHTARI